MNTSSSSASDLRPTRARRDFPPATTAPIEIDDVSLRFLSYHDKQYSIKRAVLDLLLRRQNTAQTSDFWALRDLRIRIRSGDRVGIVGHNGAGKSTLLRLMARIYPPSSGSISIRGKVAPLIEMGAGFNPELSGHDNILLNGALLGFSRKQMLERIDGIWEFTGLREFADLPLKYYSSGMYVRLAFAVATEIEPDILLIDESLGVGDATFVDKAKARLRSLMERCDVVVIVSHDTHALLELCNRGLWMDHGRLIADGPIQDIVPRYLEHAHNRVSA